MTDEWPERPTQQPHAVYWISESYPVNAVPGLDYWNGAPIRDEQGRHITDSLVSPAS